MNSQHRLDYFSLVLAILVLSLFPANSLRAASGGSAGNPLLGGRSAGSAKVGNSGAANFSIPIMVPPGTNGVQPNLAFTYNSQSQENEILGIHWQLSGLSTIERCPRTIAQDNFKGGVNYDANDRFCLDGARLILVSGSTYGADNTEYRTEIDSGIKVKAFGTAGNGPSYFKAWTKGGEVMEFGNTADSKVEAQGKTSVRVWALNKTQDVNGNYLNVTYSEDNANGHYRAVRIDYTGNTGLTPNRSVWFFYESRTDVHPMYVGASVIKDLYRLTNVKTYVGTTLVKNYKVAYQYGTATKRSQVTSIQECADDACSINLPANTFVWQDASPGLFQTTTTPYPAAGWNSNYSWTGDFNGDGKMDLISNQNQFVVQLSNGNGTFTTVTSPYPAAGWNSNYVWLGDFNGDGKTDMVSNNNQFIVALSNGDGTFTTVNSPYGPGWLGVGSYVWAGDFNGDGKTDLVANNNQFIVALSNGDGTFTTVTSPYPAAGWHSSYVRLGDFNGDGKTDMMSNNNQFVVALSNGDGSFTIVVTPYGSGWAGADIYIWAGDFNGDGKTDLVANNNQFIVALSNGDGTFTTVNSPYGPGWLGAGSYVWQGDFNGDGKDDLVANVNQFVLAHSAGPIPDLITSISNGFGGTNTLTYKPITDNTVYVTDAGTPYAAVYPNMEYRESLYVVSNMTVSDGLGASYASSYTYGGGKFHHLGRGWLGFRWMESNDLSAKVRSKEFLNQTFPFTGTSSESEVYDATIPASPVLFAETWNTYPSVAPNPYPGVYLVAPNRTDAFQYDGQSTPRQTARTMEYDTYGNVTRVNNLGDVNVSGDERDERTEWIVDVANWLHRPKRTALYDSAGALVREKWLYYDNQAYGVLGAKGLVTKEEANAGGGIAHANNPIGTHVYDATFGVKTSVTDARGCTTTTTYEATKTFPATVTNCLNHQSTMVYDARFGVVTSQTDANGQTSASEYDLFGRRTKVIGPLDSSTYPTVLTEYLNWGTPAQQRIKTSKREQHGQAAVLWSEQYFDGLGRIDFTRQEGPGGQTIDTDETHDSRGLITAKSAPYFSTGETPKYTSYRYDTLRRQTRITHADGNIETTAYTPGKVTLTDERGKVRRKFFDAHGQLTKVEEVNGADTYVTTYAYNAAGSLTTVVNHLGHTTRMAYDMLGRKTAMCDPNMGTASGITSCTTASVGAWVYTYNNAGDLLTQKDAKNQTLTFTYDVLGRPLTKKQGTTSLVAWTYDDPTVLYSKGKATQIVDQAVTTKFAYDQLGRTTQTQRLQMGVWQTMAQSYDALSRIASETFPDNDTVSYTYNEAGWLSTVPGYINGITYNARGQKTALTYANNLTTTWTFDANSFRVTNRTTSSNQQNLTYGYDANGNITTITDSLFTASRTFGYDDLNRLTSASGTFGVNQATQNCSYSYNAIGNLTNKCGTAFSYGDAMHPSAVTFNPLTGRNYSYDANGNMLTRGDQTLAWDIDNRVSSVAISGGGTTLMEYDYTGMRVKKNAPGGTTLYPFAGYEIDPSGTKTKFIRIGVETFASKKTTSGGTATKYFYHNDHLGSVNVITNITGERVQLNEYDPWGSVSRASGTIDPTHRFNGKELDPESGLYYYGGRYYDAEISRFISPDPFVPQAGNPQSLNRYSYVLNNPQNYTDPSGFFFKKLWKAIKKFFTVVLKAILPVVKAITGAVMQAASNSYGTYRWGGSSQTSWGGGSTSSWNDSGGDGDSSRSGETRQFCDCDPELGRNYWLDDDDYGGRVMQVSDEGERPKRAPFGSSSANPPTFTGTPSGHLVMIPGGFTHVNSRTNDGIVYQHPQAKGDAYQLRIMPPGADARYPKGYIVYTNKSGQALDISGKPGNPAGRSATHHELTGRPIPGLEKWYREVAREFGGK